MGDDLRSSREGSFKLILDRARNHRSLFDLQADPRERHDVSRRHPQVARRLEEALDRHDETAIAPGKAVELTPEILERLRALGYADPSEPAS